MKKLLTYVCCIIALCACGEKNTPSTPNNGKDDSSTTTVVKPTSKFTYTKQSSFVIEFTNKSTDATSYKWDFGDGTTSTEKNPVHKYSSAGSYMVTLSAINSKWRAESSQKVTITAPTTCYVTGVCFEKVGKNNKYYKAKLEDSGPYTKKVWFTTSYTRMLTNSDCPYPFIFQNKVELTNIAKHDYYTIYVYWSDNTGGNGTQILAQKIYRDSEMYKDYPTAITKENINKDTKITVYFEWK